MGEGGCIWRLGDGGLSKEALEMGLCEVIVSDVTRSDWKHTLRTVIWIVCPARCLVGVL